jgi:hypothetical protein
VLAQSGNHVLAAGGLAGIRRSLDAGATWLSPTTGAGEIVDNIHAFGGSPFSEDQAYVVNHDTELYYTEDAGDNWTKIPSAPAGGPSCGGIRFVKAVERRIRRGLDRSRAMDLYFGDRCHLAKLSCSAISGTNRFDYGGAWTALKIDHDDTRDLAFDNGRQPLLLATDGGLHQTGDGGLNWNLIGGGHNGYNALQITEIRGQLIDDIHRHDLYFGTQDNNLYSSENGGATWTFGICCEGFFIEALHHVPTAADSQITFESCGTCANHVSGALFTGIVDWKNPPGYLLAPKIIGKSFHVQAINDSGSMRKGVAATQDLGASWQQYVVFPEDSKDLPKLSKFQHLLPVLYQSIRTGWDLTRKIEIDHLVRISSSAQPLSGVASPGTVTITYPAMNDFGGLGINPTTFAWYQVFGVNPRDSAHIIAPDVVNEKMMETRNSGNDWTEIPNLTSLVTDSGRLLFRKGIFPQASAVAFSYDNPNMVAVGTLQGGIFLSDDRGVTWSKVPASELVTYITAFEWRSATDLIVSTYGRGLWRLRRNIRIPGPYFLSPSEIVHPLGPDPVPEKLQKAVLVFDGQIQGARVSKGVLQELFVQPGASMAFVADSTMAPKLKMTETTKKVGFTGAPWASSLTKVKNLAGFTLGKDDIVGGAVFSEKRLSTREPEPKESEELRKKAQEEEKHEPIGNKQSPTTGKPYVQMTGPPEQPNRFVPGKSIQLSGKDFVPETPVEITIDDRVVEKVIVNRDGVFQVATPVPQEFGLHTLTVRDGKTGKVIDGAMFIVSHEDKPSPKSSPTPKMMP